MSSKGKPPWSKLGNNKPSIFDPGKFGSFFNLSEIGSQFSNLPLLFNANMLNVCLIELLSSVVEKDASKSFKISELLLSELRKIGMIDEAYNAEEFGETRKNCKRMLYKMVTMALASVSSNAGQVITSLQPVKMTIGECNQQYQSTQKSRYSSEYDVLGFISKGGFGQVFKAKNRLDGCKYAIKQIFVRTDEEFYESLVKEVTVLARLQHPNIVKYYTSWIEPAALRTIPSIRILEEGCDSNLSESSNNYYVECTSSNDQKVTNSNNKKDESTSGSSYIQFRAEESHILSSEIKVESVEIEEVCKVTNITQVGSIEIKEVHNVKEQITTGSKSNSYEKKATAAVVPVKSNPGAGCCILYIQMELCGRSLRQWLDWRPVEAEPSSMLGALQLKTRFSYFWQLASALEYLHEQGIVHHDIKPSNIFVFGNYRLKLGDFGLACSYEASKNQSHHAWGTRTYAAPEQLDGGLCNYKSDVYSTGVVLLEMLMPPFKTHSERYHILGQLREHAILPEIINSQLSRWGKLILNLTKTNPLDRLSASELKKKTENLMCQYNFDSLESTDEQSITSETIISNTSVSHFEIMDSAYSTSYIDGLSLEGMQEYHRSYRYSNKLFSFDRNSSTVTALSTLRDDRNIFEETDKRFNSLKLVLMEKDLKIKKLQEKVRLLSLQLKH